MIKRLFKGYLLYLKIKKFRVELNLKQAINFIEINFQ